MKKNELKIGLTIIISLLIAIIGFRLMQDVPIFRPSLQLYTVFNQVDGISSGSSVFMSGVKIGSVNRVTLAGPDSVIVLLNLSYDQGIPVGSRAYIEPSDLIGGKRIRIQHSGKTEWLPDGGYIKGAYDEGLLGNIESFTEELKPGVKRSIENLEGSLFQINSLLKEGGKENLSETLRALEHASLEVSELLQQRKGDLEASILSVKQFVANLDTLSSGRQPQLDSLLTNLEDSSKKLAVISDEMRGTSRELHQIMTQINSGDGTLGKLLYDPSLYDNLDSLAVSFIQLSKKIQEDPRHFLKHMRLIEIF